MPWFRQSAVALDRTKATAVGEEAWRAGCSFLIGALPFAHIVAKRAGGVDLRSAHPESVSASGVYRAAGLAPFLLASALDVTKGYVAIKVAGRDRPALALYAGLVVAGHNWSPFLRGAGGRGITPATGALLASNWRVAAVMLGGPAIGYVFRSSALGSFVSQLLLVPMTLLLRKRESILPLVAILIPIWVKRIIGNDLEVHWRLPLSRYVERLLYDRDKGES